MSALTSPATTRRTPPSVTLVIVALAASAFALMQSLAVPVLPRIQTELDTDQSTVSWVLTAYLLSAAVFTPILGRVGDGVGKHRMFVVSLGFLAVGSLVCAVAPSIGVLIAGRVVTGVGGAVVPLAFGIIRDELPGPRVAGAVGFLSSLLAVGFGGGIVIAGPIVDGLGYTWLFWIPGIATAVVAAAAAALVPASPTHLAGRPPLLSALFLAAWLITFLLGVSRAPDVGWTAPSTLTLIAASLLLVAGWVVVEATVAVPLIDLPLMRRRAVWTANLLALTVGASMYAVFAFLPQFLQTPASTGYGLGADTTESGLLILPHAVVSFAIGLLAAPLSRRFSRKRVIIVGCLVGAIGVQSLALLHDHRAEIVAANILVGLGMSAVFASLAPLVLGAVPREQSGVAAGMNTNIRSIGGAIGTAATATVVTSTASGTDLLPAEHGYVIAFTAVAVLMVLSAGIAGLVPRPAQSA